MRRYPGRGPMRAWVMVLLAGLLALASCAPPWAADTAHHPTPKAAPVSPLASETIYWDQGMSLWALRASDARVRWQIHGWSAPLPDCDGCTVDPGTPTFDHGTLYTLTINDRASSAVYAFSAADGATRWQTPVAGCSASRAPLVADGVVYVALTNRHNSNVRCGASGWVYALRTSDGQVLWRVPFERAAYSVPVLTNGVVVVADSTYPAVPEVFSLTGLRASDGKQLWRISHMATLTNFTAWNGVVFTSGGTSLRGDSALSMEAFRASDGTPVWKTVLASSSVGWAAPYAANGTVYIRSDDGYLNALRASDGHIVWRFHTGAESVGTPVVANGRLYVGVGPLLDVIDATSGAFLHTYPLFNPAGSWPDVRYDWSPPIVTDTAIFVSAGAGYCWGDPLCGDDLWKGHLYALDVATGKILWQYRTPENFWASTPVLGT